MTKKEFFEKMTYWESNKNQALRIMSWELYQLELIDTNYIEYRAENAGIFDTIAEYSFPDNINRANFIDEI